MKKIKGFDGIRAICAFMVLYSHSEFSITHVPEQGIWLNLYKAGFSGGSGVLVFFVLSGFLISQLLWNELSKMGTIRFGNFIMRRVLRLLPVYLVYLSIITVFAATGVLEVKAIALVSALTYTYNFLPVTFGSGYTNHLWSLAVEEQFYLFFPLLMKKVPSKSYLRSIVFIIIGGLVLVNLVVQIPLPDYEFVYRGQLENLQDVGIERIVNIGTLFLPAGLYCLTGCLFGLSQQVVGARLFKGVGRTSLAFLAAIVLYFNVVLFNIPFYGVNQVIQCVGVGLCLVYIQHRQGSWAVKLLEFGPLPYLGRISYGTYVWHGLFIATGPGACIYWWQGIPFGFVFTYLTAMISFDVVEKPFLRLKQRF